MEGGLFEAHTAFSVTYLLLVFIELSCIIYRVFTPFYNFFMIYYEIKQNKHDTDFFLGGGEGGGGGGDFSK